MAETKRIKTALISVYHKEGLDEIITKLNEEGVEFFSTGGTRQFIESLGIPCKAVEELTAYPPILGGRVKTLHPKVFGGILCRRAQEQDRQQIEKYAIPEIDLVIVDLYPFEATVAVGAEETDVIEKIDIGGISLIRAAAKNYNDVVVVASQAQYQPFRDMLMEHGSATTREERKWLAKEAFGVSSHYDAAIFNYFDQGQGTAFRYAAENPRPLAEDEGTGERATFFAHAEDMLDQMNGSIPSATNLKDLQRTLAVLEKNATSKPMMAGVDSNTLYGPASGDTLKQAWEALLSQNGNAPKVVAANADIDSETAKCIDEANVEVVVAPDYDVEALETLGHTPKRIVMVKKPGMRLPGVSFQSLLNGVLVYNNKE